MDTAPDHIIAARDFYELKFADAVKRAEAHMDLADINEDDEEALMDAHDERHHCPTCIVRNVMEIMMDPIEEYITILEQAVADK